MISYTLRSQGLSQQAALQRWVDHPFFTSSVVLGIDIGLRGIGICIRKGPEIVYAKTWMIDLPPSKALADRRAKRAWRHCRENRKTRLKRLKGLFEKHGLPWLDEDSDAMRRTDPFLLRHRALESKLGSREALSIVIRHIVSHRGYDYQYFNEEGAYPWGDATEFKKVMPELQSLWLEAADATRVLQDAEGFGWNDADLAAFETLGRARTITPERDPIRAKLARHAKQKRAHIRPQAKGEAFPRTLVWNHLADIVGRHRDLLDDVDGFIAALAVKPQEDKAASIFFYHRKTPEEMRKHFEKKVRKCRYAPWLGLADEVRCAERGDRDVSRFLLLEFLATRRLQLANETLPLVYLSTDTLTELLRWHDEYQDAFAAKAELPQWKDGKKIITSALKKEYGSALRVKSEFNQLFLDTLGKLIAPKGAIRRGRASLSSEASRELFRIATATGLDPANIRQQLEAYHKEKRSPSVDAIGLYPQVEFLLGRHARKDRTPTKKHPNRKQRNELAVKGRLHRLFEDLAPQIGSITVPDYAVVEVIGDPPRTEQQAKDLLKEQQKRHESRVNLFKEYKVEDNHSRTRRLRLKLYYQQNGRSPYTGDSLGADPLADHLQIEHVYPESRGGLWVEENLVLATRTENERKGQRTPRLAAQDLAGSWDTMLTHTNGMRWSEKKKDVFKWEKDTVPDFGNTTRTSQMARQLSVQLAQWMAIDPIEDPTERENLRAERIGTPAGHLTATARAAWQMPKKDRNNLVHHMVDAITLSCIPPREGVNAVRYGGIFFTQCNPDTGKSRLSVLPVGPDPVTVKRLSADNSDDCPVVHFRSSGSRASRHDQTMLSVGHDGRLSSRAPLDREAYGGDPAKLLTDLLNTGYGQSDLPSRDVLERWLLAEDRQPLLLKNGAQIRRVRKTGKENFTPPLGTTGRIDIKGRWQGVKVINSGKFEAAALVRRWHPPQKKRRGYWSFHIQRRPDRHAIESLLRLGFRWLEASPDYGDDKAGATLADEADKLRNNPQRWRYLTVSHVARRTLRLLCQAGFLADDRGNLADWTQIDQAIWGSPFQPGDQPVIDPVTRKPSLIRIGDLFRLEGRVSRDAKMAPQGGDLQWHRVSSILSANKVEFVPMLTAARAPTTRGAESLACLFGATKFDDPPPDPIARGPVDSPPAGEADFRLQPDRD